MSLSLSFWDTNGLTSLTMIFLSVNINSLRNEHWPSAGTRNKPQVAAVKS